MDNINNNLVNDNSILNTQLESTKHSSGGVDNVANKKENAATTTTLLDQVKSNYNKNIQDSVVINKDTHDHNKADNKFKIWKISTLQRKYDKVWHKWT